MSIYGCHNKQRPMIGTYLDVQDGNHSQDPEYRIARMVNVPYVMTEECQYTKTHAADKLCAGCIHHNKEAS